MKRLVDMNSNYIGTPDTWVEFIKLWDNKRVELDLEECNLRYQPRKFDSFLINDQIELTENRLGIILPKSYKDFILATNSLVPSWFLTECFDDLMLPIEQINWLKDINSTLVFNDYSVDSDFEVMDDEYYKYDIEQDEYSFKRKYLKSCLKLNYCDNYTGYEILLNTLERTKDREMETWHFYTGEGFAARFKSFAEMIVTRYILDVTQEDASMHFLDLSNDPYGYSSLLIMTV